MTATDVTGFDAIFSTGLLSPDFRGLVLLNCTEILEKKQNQWRASSGNGAPKLQISALVVFELLLTKWHLIRERARHKYAVANPLYKHPFLEMKKLGP